MVELIPKNIDGVVVLNVLSRCSPNCSACADITVGIHNWLLVNNLKYVVVDFQDEKVVCSTFIEELLQLKKRLKFPFVFIGVMEKPKQTLEAFDYRGEFPLFASPEEAVGAFRARHPDLINASLENVTFGIPLAVVRPGSRLITGEEGEEGQEEEGVNADEVENVDVEEVEDTDDDDDD